MKLGLKTIGLLFFLFFTVGASAQVKKQTVGTFVNDEGAFDGYNLVSSVTGQNIYLIDNCGLKVHEWKTQHGTLVAYLLPNGDIVQAGKDPLGTWGNGGQHGVLTKYSWDGTKIWTYTLSNEEEVLHHDIEILPNGNILAISWKKIDRDKKIELGRDLDDPDLDLDLWDEVIYEFKPVGSNSVDVVWSWRVTDHLVQDLYSSKSNYGVISEHPEKLNFNYVKEGTGISSDWLHFNSIDYNESLDQIVVSSLTTNEIYIIDHSGTTSETGGGIGGNSGKGGDILYRWGNPEAYDKGTSDDRQSFGQHDPHWIKYGEHQGKLMFFNNRFGGNYTSVDILELPENGLNYALDANGKFGPSEPIYQFTTPNKTDFFSAFMGAAEILPNGHIYVTESTKGKLFEYDMENDKLVWSYISPMRNSTLTKQGDSIYANQQFRSFKYASDYGAFTNRNLTPGLPLEQDPWPSDCNGIDTTTKQDTTKQDTTHTGGGAWVQSVSQQTISIYPNPSNGIVNIKAWNNIDGLKIADITGKVLVAEEKLKLADTAQFDFSNIAEGVYFVTYSSNGYTKTERLILSYN
jgi:hypothetical protein